MFASWTMARKDQADALANAESAEKFWSTLPQDNPFETQRRLCDELAKAAGGERRDADRFRALRQLDRHADRLLEGFVSEYAALCGQSTVLERQLRLAALELSRAFADEFERLLRFADKPVVTTAWRERTSELAVRLFRHREIELVLVLSRYERWPRGRWKSLHDAYKFLLSMDVATLAVPSSRRAEHSVITVTPEQAYIRILLLQRMDGGRFRPEEIAWARRQIVRWSGALALHCVDPMIDPTGSRKCFVVNMAGTEGLAGRPAPGSGDWLWLDTTPIAGAIDARMAESRNATNGVTTSTWAHLQLNLLRKLRDLYDPKRPHVKRRGERIVAGLASAEATLGDLQTIFRMLRDEAKSAIEASNVPLPDVEEITITDVGSLQGSPAAPPAGVALHRARSARVTASTTWQIRDRSGSGTRLRGSTADSSLLIPGLLIAFRDGKPAPWTVAVVRRSSRLMGSNVELGVEHLGRDPQRVILLSDVHGAQETDARPARIGALYLPESEACPRMPIRTLLMPMCEYASGRVMTMRSKTSQIGIRLKEPLERQASFVWTSFELVEAAADR